MPLPDLPPVLHIDVTAPGVRFDVQAPVVELDPTDTPVLVAVAPGPPGPQGPPGSGDEDPTTWYGQGPPGTIIGSSPGDYYVDTETGTIYKLGD